LSNQLYILPTIGNIFEEMLSTLSDVLTKIVKQMNSSKQQKQVLLVLMAARPKGLKFRISDIIRQVTRRLYNSRGVDSAIQYPGRKTPDKKLVSFTRTLKRLREEGYVESDWPYWFITDKGYEKGLEIKRQIKKLREEVEEFELLTKLHY